MPGLPGLPIMIQVDTPKQSELSKKMANVRIKFDAALLLQVAPFIAKTDIRYYLNGLRIESAGPKRAGIYLIATDGHRMGVVYDPNGAIVGDDGKGVIMRVPSGLLAACRKTYHHGRGLPNMVLASGSRVSVAPDFGLEHSEYESYIMPGQPWIEGKFPIWSKVLPVFADLKPGMNSSLKVRYLADFEKIVPREHRKYGAFISMWQTKPDAMVVVQVHALPNFIGIVMPMRAESEDDRRTQMAAMFSSQVDAEPVAAPTVTVTS